MRQLNDEIRKSLRGVHESVLALLPKHSNNQPTLATAFTEYLIDSTDHRTAKITQKQE